jgi:hypothetical protein
VSAAGIFGSEGFSRMPNFSCLVCREFHRIGLILNSVAFNTAHSNYRSGHENVPMTGLIAQIKETPDSAEIPNI